MINIIQSGADGFGHQLYGLFSCLLLHNIKNYYFDGYAFINKSFQFEHIDKKQSEAASAYMIEVVKEFIKIFNIQPIFTNKYIHSHEIYNIPPNPEINTLHGVDNAYYFDRLGLNASDLELHSMNIDIVKPCFINKYLPSNIMDEKNIVLHLRLGDAMAAGRGNSINNYNKQLSSLIDILIKKYPGYKYYLHTDGDISFIIDVLQTYCVEYHVFQKNTQILSVIRDLIHARILICGNSALSKVCAFLGNKELTIINDDNTHSMPKNACKISDYIISNLQNKN
jgi:hypothetical protein